MDKRWKNLLAIMVIIGFFGLAYYFLFQPPGFEQRLARMKAYWKKYEIEEPLHLSYEKLNNLSERELKELKANLLQFNETETNPAARELSDAYVSLVDVSIYRKKMLEKQASLSAEADPCSALSEFDLLTQYKESLLESTKSYLEKVDSFVANNPEKAEELELQKGNDALELEETVKEHKRLVAQLKEVCK